MKVKNRMKQQIACYKQRQVEEKLKKNTVLMDHF